MSESEKFDAIIAGSVAGYLLAKDKYYYHFTIKLSTNYGLMQ